MEEVKIEMGIQETGEVLEAGIAVAAVVVKQLKDGFQVLEDGLALYNKIIGDPEFRDAILRAYDGIGKVPTELKDLTFEEGIDLGIIALHGSKKLIVALK